MTPRLMELVERNLAADARRAIARMLADEFPCPEHAADALAAENDFVITHAEVKKAIRNDIIRTLNLDVEEEP
jgi:hypothetical protein